MTVQKFETRSKGNRDLSRAFANNRDVSVRSKTCLETTLIRTNPDSVPFELALQLHYDFDQQGSDPLRLSMFVKRFDEHSVYKRRPVNQPHQLAKETT